MRTTASRVLAAIAPFVRDSGVCITDPAGLADAIYYLNLGCKLLHKRIDEDFSTLWTWSMPVYDNCFALPEDCLEGRQMWINGVTATQHDQWYQGKLACGLADPGSIRYGPEVIDLGQFALPHPMAKIQDLRLGFIAESDADAGKVVQIEIVDSYGQNQRESITLPAKQGVALTESTCFDLAWLQKPVTESNVKLYTVYPNGQRFFLCDYAPKTQLGAWRRKRIPQCYFGCKYVTIKGKARYIPIDSENDIIPFDDEVALGWAVMAASDFQRRDEAAHASHLQMALNEVMKGMKDGDSPSNVAYARIRTGMGPNPSKAANNPMPGTSFYGRGGWGAGWGFR